MINTLHIVCGCPGAGKTTYGKALAARHKAVLLDIDTVTEAVVKAGLVAARQDPDDRDSAVFKLTFREPVYECLFDTAMENLAYNHVVLVGPFSREIEGRDWLVSLQSKGIELVQVHYLYCEPNVRKQRLIARANPRDKAKIAEWDVHLDYYQAKPKPEFHHLFVDTTHRKRPD